jgi:ATP-dependent exoDNAse (exonuclease V) alpha subunit
MTQTNALDILKMGHNIFLTGSAGSGKTYVLNAYIKYLREHSIDVAVTASTGIAATHMGGMTIHAWSGIGIRDMLSDYDIDQMETKKYLWDRFEKVKVLVIDEISMLSGNFLDNLDRLCRGMKRNDTVAFGGIQIILCGDLFQLPPISRGNAPADFVVHANAWRSSGLAMCYLTEQHRQEDDVFLDILNAIRKNELESYHFETLESRIREYHEEDFQNITKLFTHNADVDSINDKQLAGLDTDQRIFYMTSKGKTSLIENLKKSCLAPETLKLKIGTEVMFVKNNFDKGYVNGTRGIIIDFDSEMDLPIVKTLDGEKITVDTENWSVEDEGKILASITQIPLRHAWAITVHKSQGMSLDAAVIDLSKSFTYGMGYVALSRVRTLEGVHLLGISPSALAVDPTILIVDQQLQSLSDRAVERLDSIETKKLQTTHNDFITRCGGTIEAIKLTKKELKNVGKI